MPGFDEGRCDASFACVGGPALQIVTIDEQIGREGGEEIGTLIRWKVVFATRTRTAPLPPLSPLHVSSIINHAGINLCYGIISSTLYSFPSIRTAHGAALLTVINPVNVAASIRLLALARRSHTRQSLGRGSLEREMEIFPSRRDRFVQIFLKFEES